MTGWRILLHHLLHPLTHPHMATAPACPAADRDNFLSPKQAIELGLIDGVIA